MARNCAKNWYKCLKIKNLLKKTTVLGVENGVKCPCKCKSDFEIFANKISLTYLIQKTMLFTTTVSPASDIVIGEGLPM